MPVILRTAFILLSLLFLSTFSSCSPKIDFSSFNFRSQNPEDIIEQTEISLEDVLAGKSLVAIANNNTLYLIDPEFAKPFPIYSFEKEEQPIKNTVESYLISPTKQWIVWYTPVKGVMALNIQSQKATSIYPPNEFLNTYPYFEFMEGEDLFLFITNNGNGLYHYNLSSLNNFMVDIPYPYGNVFKIAPDSSNVLFVSGYGQTKSRPRFMFTPRQGKAVTQFTAKTNLFDRNYVFWAPDSSGVIMINENTLEFYSLNDPENPQTFISLSEGATITSTKRVKDKIFILSSKGYWHMYDYYSKKEVARSPVEIASELNNPRFIPWSESEFLIEEIVLDGPSQFNRLWVSNFKGSKKIVMERYNEITIQTDPQYVE